MHDVWDETGAGQTFIGSECGGVQSVTTSPSAPQQHHHHHHGLVLVFIRWERPEWHICTSTIHSNEEKWMESIQAPQCGDFRGRKPRAGEACLHGNSGAWQLSNKMSHFLKLEEAPKLPCQTRNLVRSQSISTGWCMHPLGPWVSVSGG